ncbi:MAG: hypothetical protein ACFFDT_11920 [Candidatus Hodarchaeota archaeon]
MEEENNSRMMAKVRYYLKENELTRPFFDPRLLIVPGLFFILGILPGGGGDTALRLAISLLFWELVAIYLVIMYKRIHTVIENQKEIIAQLNGRKRS